MTAFALHLPEQRKPGRWLFAAAVILAVHAGIMAALVWHRRTPPPAEYLPAIAVSLAPVQSAAPQAQTQEDLPIGPEMQQADAPPPEPPKQEEQKVDQQVPPPPAVENAEAALPKPEPKQIEQPRPDAQPPAPETTAPPKSERVGTLTQAASNAYNALILGHLRRFIRYPAAAHGARGIVTIRFTINRDGRVTETAVSKSSGNSVLDQEAIEILRRASPFPPFPAAKSGSDALYFAPINFDRS
jgi:periplasmic protein TonB